MASRWSGSVASCTAACAAAHASAYPPATAPGSRSTPPNASVHDTLAPPASRSCSSCVGHHPAWISAYLAPGPQSHSCHREPAGPLPHRNSFRPRSPRVDVWAKPRAVGLDGHDVPTALPLQVVEVVGGKPGGHRVADVDVRAIRVRDGHPDQGAGVVGAPGGVRRGQHAGPRRLGHRDVGPVVERLLLRVRVDHPGRGVQPVRPWEQGEVDLQHQVTGPLPLPQPQHVTVRTGNHCGVHRPARQRRVAGRAEVPLDAPGEPGIGQPEVREVQHRVAEQQLTPTGVVVQRPDPAAERRQHGRAQHPVLEHVRRELDLAQRPVVVLLEGVRERAFQPAVGNPLEHVRRGARADVGVGQLPQPGEPGQRARGTEGRRPHGQRRCGVPSPPRRAWRPRRQSSRSPVVLVCICHSYAVQTRPDTPVRDQGRRGPRPRAEPSRADETVAHVRDRRDHRLAGRAPRLSRRVAKQVSR